MPAFSQADNHRVPMSRAYYYQPETYDCLNFTASAARPHYLGPTQEHCLPANPDAPTNSVTTPGKMLLPDLP